MVALVGPNGAGKSSLLRVITGLLPAQGSVQVAGVEVSRLCPRARAKLLAVVPQEIARDIPYSARDFVLLGRTASLPRFGGPSADDFKAVHDAMALTETWHLRQRPLPEMSGGERQRLALAMALADRPEIILLDEPTSHLDLRHRAEMMRLLMRLNLEQRTTVLMVVHDLTLASQFFPRLVLLSEGRKFADGTPRRSAEARRIGSRLRLPRQRHSPARGLSHLHSTSSVTTPGRPHPTPVSRAGASTVRQRRSRFSRALGASSKSDNCSRRPSQNPLTPKPTSRTGWISFSASNSRSAMARNEKSSHAAVSKGACRVIVRKSCPAQLQPPDRGVAAMRPHASAHLVGERLEHLAHGVAVAAVGEKRVFARQALLLELGLHFSGVLAERQRPQMSRKALSPPRAPDKRYPPFERPPPSGTPRAPELPP